MKKECEGGCGREIIADYTLTPKFNGGYFQFASAYVNICKSDIYLQPQPLNLQEEEFCDVV